MSSSSHSFSPSQSFRNHSGSRPGTGNSQQLPGIFRNLQSRQGHHHGSSSNNNHNASTSSNNHHHNHSSGGNFNESLMDMISGSGGNPNQQTNPNEAPPQGVTSNEFYSGGSGGGDMMMMNDSADIMMTNPLANFSQDKLDKIKRGLWFILRGQKINNMDGITEFFEQVKEEMSRQQLRDESSKAGGTANLVENMMTQFTQSTAASGSSAFGSSFASSSASINNINNSSAASLFPASRQGKRNHATAAVRASSPSAVSHNPLQDFDVEKDPALIPNNQEKNKSMRLREEEASVLHAKMNNNTNNDDNNNNNSDQQQNNQNSSFFGGNQQNNESVSSVVSGQSGGLISGMTFKEAKTTNRLRPKMILDEIPETEDQKEQGRITSFIEEWSDSVSLCIIFSQLFVLTSVCYHAGFNVPIGAANLVVDKLFGDLVAIISIVYRCVAPFKSHGRWHFDKQTRFWNYFKSGDFVIDFIGVFPIDLIGLGLGFNCAQFRPDQCASVNGLFQLNRLLQCRGMFTNFGSVAETLFLRRGLHPILGRCAEVLLFLICLTHVVGSIFNFLLSRGDKAGLDDFFDPNFEQEPLALQYFLVLDWAIKSLVGLSPRGTSFPNSGLDQAYIIVITIMGVAVFTNYIATIKLYFDRDCPEKTHYQNVDETIDMVNYMRLDDAFRDDCLDYFNHMFSARFHVQGMKDFEDDLTGGLARKMKFVVGRELVQHVPLLRSLKDNEPFVVSLMQRIEPLVLPPNTTIFKRDDRGSTMLVIIKGFVNVLSPKDDKTVVATLGSGKVVGEVALLMDSPRTATVTSCGEFLNVMSLDRRQMSELIMLFPEIAPILMAEMATRMQQLSKK